MRTLVILSLLLPLLLCAWQCSEAPPSVLEQVLPAVEETRPIGTDADMAFALKMEAIMQSEGEVLSPIPNAVYQKLWGHFTKAGSLAPRQYYTKYIDADGIAIVSGDLVDDRLLQATRHICLVMTSKLPGLRDALSIHQNSSILGEIPFRFTLTAMPFGEDGDEPFDIADPSTWPEVDAGNLPERTGGITHLYPGVCGGTLCRADVGFPPPSWGSQWENHMSGMQAVIHEMAHAIDYAIVEHNLIPDFAERLNAGFTRESEKKRLYEEEGVPLAEDETWCAVGGSHAYTNPAEFWATAVAEAWFDGLWHPTRLALNPDWPDWRHERCPLLHGLMAEVFPPFPLQEAILHRDYTRRD